jgi:hypothetical protein
VLDVGRDDRAAAGDLAAHELGVAPSRIATKRISSVTIAAPRVVHLREVLVAARRR